MATMREMLASREADLARLAGRGFEWHGGTWPGARLCASHELFADTAYLCAGGVWTIGWGETARRTVKPGMRITAEWGDARFNAEWNRYAEAVEDMLEGVPHTPNELSALTVFAYNVGLEGLRTSSALRKFRQGDKIGAARALELWNKVGKVVEQDGKRVRILVENDGLTRRRKEEGALLLTPEPGQLVEVPSQDIEPESKLRGSPIMRGGGVGASISTGGAAVVAAGELAKTAEAPPAAMAPEPATAATAAVDQALTLAGAVRSAVATLHEVHDRLAGLLGFSPLLILFALGAWYSVRVMYWRWRQREVGRA